MFPETFQTTRLLLRSIATGDAKPIFDLYAGDAEVTRYLVWRPHQGVTETEAYVACCLTATTSRTYVLGGREDGAVRGAFDLRQEGTGRLGFGTVLARPWWGMGLMTEALTEIASWALRQEGIWRIGAVCDVDNLASARVMEKAGLTREGLLRRWSIHPNVSGEPRDCFVFSKVR